MTVAFFWAASNSIRVFQQLVPFQLILPNNVKVKIYCWNEHPATFLVAGLANDSWRCTMRALMRDTRFFTMRRYLKRLFLLFLTLLIVSTSFWINSSVDENPYHRVRDFSSKGVPADEWFELQRAFPFDEIANEEHLR